MQLQADFGPASRGSTATRVLQPQAKRYSAFVLSGILAVANSLQAQEPPRDSATRGDTTTIRAAAEDTATVRRLDRIVISALRLPTELGNAAYAVAVNGPDVTRRGRVGLGLSEPLHGIPGVQVDNRYNFALGERISVRGFGARTQFGVRGVRVLVDGIPATMPDGQTTLNHLDLGTIQSVEVVRSPIAALYGNAAGGVIAIETIPAPASVLSVTTRLVNGADGLSRQQAGAGGTTPAGSYTLNVGRLRYDGYRAHNEASSRYASARTTTHLGATDFALAMHKVGYDALNPGALPDSLLRRDRTAAFPTNITQRTGESGRHAQLGVTLRHRLGGQQLTTAAYVIRRTLDNPIPPRIIDLSRRAGGVRVSFGSAESPDASLQWDAGIETATQRDDRRNYVNTGGTRGNLTLDQLERVRAAALFAAARLNVTRGATLQLGLRRDATSFTAADRLVTESNPDDTGEREMRAWSPSVGLSVRLPRENRLFANFGSAYETPTTTELANRPTGAGGFNPELDAQRTRSYEIGLNGFAQRFYYQIAVYRARVAGALVPFEVADTPGRQFFRNAASVIHRGGELMIGGSLAANVSGRATYAFTDARFRDYLVDGSSLAGNRVAGVAPHRVETLVRYSSVRLFLDLESRYQTSVPVNDANTTRSPAYALHGLRGGLTSVRLLRLTIAPFVGVDNLLNREYNSSVVVNAAAERYFEPGPGRTVYLGTELAVGAGRHR